MLKSPPLVATLSDSMRMSPCSWGDIFTWPLRGDRIIGLRHGFRELCAVCALCGEIFRLLPLLDPLADSKHMPIRVSHVHLAGLPRHVRRRKRHIQSPANAFPVHLIHVVHPHRHPRPLVPRLVSVLLEGSSIRSFAAPALRPLAKKYLHLA